MHFANGGNEALEVLEQQSFDVVVSDMRMPDVDGAELLTQVSRLYPNTVRIVLSGQSEHEKILRAIGPAHQFLSKPCDPEVLISTIERACGLHSLFQDDSLKNLVSQLSSIPSLPQIYQDLVRALETDDASVHRIGEKIAADIGMTAKILQLVNSSFFGLPQHVSCPAHAVSLLGLNIVRPLVLSASAFSQYKDPGIEGFSLEGLVRHSLATATTARRIAEVETDQSQVVDDAFIAGMMHDIGKLVLAVNLPEEYATAVGLAKDMGIALWQAEKKVFGSTHAEIGGHLLGLWGLPNPIVEAVAFHHRPSSTGSSQFTALTAVYAANVLRRSNCLDDITPETPVWNTAYIEAIGAADRLETWETMTRKEPIA